MAYLLPKDTIYLRNGWRGDESPEAPGYFVVSSCGQRKWRIETLTDWLNRQAIHKKERIIHNSSPVSV